MDRLTGRDNGTHSAYYLQCVDEDPCYGCGCAVEDCDHHRKVCDRLAAYEDTGLTPDEIKEIQDFERSQLVKLLADNTRLQSIQLRLSKRLVKQEERTHKARQQRDVAKAEVARLQRDNEALRNAGHFDPLEMAKIAMAVQERDRLRAELKRYVQAKSDGKLIEIPEFPQDMDDILEPLKVQSALNSEVLKLNHRKEHKPNDVSILDYTIIAALYKVLDEARAEDGAAHD